MPRLIFIAKLTEQEKFPYCTLPSGVEVNCEWCGVKMDKNFLEEHRLICEQNPAIEKKTEVEEEVQQEEKTETDGLDEFLIMHPRNESVRDVDSSNDEYFDWNSTAATTSTRSNSSSSFVDPYSFPQTYTTSAADQSSGFQEQLNGQDPNLQQTGNVTMSPIPQEPSASSSSGIHSESRFTEQNIDQYSSLQLLRNVDMARIPQESIASSIGIHRESGFQEQHTGQDYSLQLLGNVYVPVARIPQESIASSIGIHRRSSSTPTP